MHLPSCIVRPSMSSNCCRSVIHEQWIFQPTFYNEGGAKKDDLTKDDAKVKIEVEAPPEKVGDVRPKEKDGQQAVEEKMDQMKITPEAETNQSEAKKADVDQ